MQISIFKFPEQKIRMNREQTRKIPCLQGVETIKDGGEWVWTKTRRKNFFTSKFPELYYTKL